MNRKKQSKLVIEDAKKTIQPHPYDDIREWYQGEMSCPWNEKQIADFQRKLDDIWGGAGIYLAWSYDRSFGDEFATDWFSDGTPKPNSWEKKPLLIQGQCFVNKTDYIYVVPPRFVLMERHHPNQYADTWESDSWVSDQNMIGGKKRVRRPKPPAAFYTHLRTIAEHEGTVIINDTPPCCKRALDINLVCFGRYKPPSDVDLIYLKEMRQRMDRDGIDQRNDEKVGVKLLTQASLSSRDFHRQAQLQESRALKEFIMAHPRAFLGSMPEERGITLSAKEIEAAVLKGLNQVEEERFG